MIYDEITEEFQNPSMFRRIFKKVARHKGLIIPYIITTAIGMLVVIGLLFLINTVIITDEPESAPIPLTVEAPSTCPAAFDQVDHMLESAESYATDMRQHHQHNVTKGDHGPSVEAFQEFLNKKADAGLKVDGIYGNETKAAADNYIKSNKKQVANTQEFLDHFAVMKRNYTDLKGKCLEE